MSVFPTLSHGFTVVVGAGHGSMCSGRSEPCSPTKATSRLRIAYNRPMMMRSLRWSLFVGLMFAVACSESTETSTTGETSGGQGASGGASAGGNGGQAPSGTGAGGQGGTSSVSTGGAGGQGGAGVASPECEKDSDCKLVDSCCDCAGVPEGQDLPCSVTDCLVNECAKFKPQPVTPVCRAGQCVTSVDCDISKVLCKSLPPDCPEGMTHSVNPETNCWGACVEETECAEVATCDQCVQNSCVTYQTKMGLKRHCVALPAVCQDSEDCTCFGPGVCTSPYDTCSMSADGLLCACMNC